jgi:hypothetical protein
MDMTQIYRKLHLNAPTRPVFVTSLTLVAAGIFFSIYPLIITGAPAWLDYSWVLIVLGYLVLVIGVTMKSL